MKNRSKGLGLGHVTYFPNLRPPNISGTAEVTNLKFACRLTVRGAKPKMKNCPKGGVA